MRVSANDRAVKGENEICECCGVFDCVGDGVVDVDRLPDEFHRNVSFGGIRMVGEVVPSPIEYLSDVHCSCSRRVSILFKSKVSGVDIACSALRTDTPTVWREICRVERRSAVAGTVRVVYRAVDKNSGGRECRKKYAEGY